MWIFSAFLLLLLLTVSAGLTVTCDPALFVAGANNWDANIWAPRAPADGDDVVCDLSAKCGGFLASAPPCNPCSLCNPCDTSGCGCQAYAWSPDNGNPPYLVINGTTPLLRSFTVSSQQYSYSRSELKTSVVVTSSGTLSADVIAFTIGSCLYLGGRNATIVCTQSLTNTDGRLGGTGLIRCPLSVLSAARAADAFPFGVSVLIPGRSKPGSLECGEGKTCSLGWPGVPLGPTVYGDLVFEGAVTLTGNAAMFIKYGGSLPASSSERFFPDDAVDRVDVRGALTINTTAGVKNVIVFLGGSGYASLDNKPASVTWQSIVQANPLNIFVPNMTTISACPCCDPCAPQTASDTFPYSGEECLACTACSVSGGPPGSTSSCAEPSSSGLSVLLSTPTSSCSAIAATGCATPCLNGGTCEPLLFFCKCVSPWFGPGCESIVSDCVGGCSLHGTCDTLSGGPICNCVRAGNVTYYDAMCSKSVSSGCAPDCAGTCTADSASGGWTCVCPPTLRGTSCQIPVCPGYDPATGTANCAGFGTCTNGACVCSTGFQLTRDGSCERAATSTTSNGLSTTALVLIIVLPVAAALVAAFVVIVLWCRKREVEKRMALFAEMQRKMVALEVIH